MNIEKLLELFQEKVLPFVAHLETKERTKLLKVLEKGENENELLLAWKEVLSGKGINSDIVVNDYLTYANGLKELNEEDTKKLKNKNTYFLRKNLDNLVKNFEELKVEKKEEVIVNEEVSVAKEGNNISSFFKGKKKNKKKEKGVRKNKNKNRVKKDRKKKKNK